MKKLICILLTIIPALLFAQKGDIELGGDVGVGLSRIGVKSDDFNTKMGLNLQGEIFTNYFFANNFGVSLGLGLDRLKSNTTATDYQSVIRTGTDATGNYQILASADDYKEMQTLNMFEIPIGLVYRKAMNEKWSLRAGLGLKVGLPYKASSELQSGLTTRLYYPDIMLDETETIRNIPLWGLNEDYSEWDGASADLDTRINFAPFVNVGASYRIKEKLSLYSALYAAYGVNDVIEDGGGQILSASDTPSPTTVYAYNSPTTFTKSNTLEFGIKLGVIFDLRKKRELPEEDESDVNAAKSTDSKPIAEEAEVPVLAVEDTPVVDAKEERPNDEFPFTVDFYAFEEHSMNDSQDELVRQKSTAIPSGAYILIDGHTCDIGSDSLNEQLGLMRAQAVKDVLVDENIDPSRILTISHGETNPKYSNDTEEDRVGNRRAEVSLFYEQLAYTIPNYKNSESSLDDEMRDQLEEIITAIKTHASDLVLLTGHTCDLGEEELNMIYGHMRSRNMKVYLVESGIEDSRIITASEGESNHKFPNDNETLRRANRRVEIIILSPDMK